MSKRGNLAMPIVMLALLLLSCSQSQIVPTLQSTVLPTLLASPTATTIPTTMSTPTPTPTPIPPWPVLANTPVPQSIAVISIENVDQVVQLARWGKGTVRQVLPSPDGKLLAVASSVERDFPLQWRRLSIALTLSFHCSGAVFPLQWV